MLHRGAALAVVGGVVACVDDPPRGVGRVGDPGRAAHRLPGSRPRGARGVVRRLPACQSAPAGPTARERSRPPSSRSSASTTTSCRSPPPPVATHRSTATRIAVAHRARDHERAEVAVGVDLHPLRRAPRRSCARARSIISRLRPRRLGLSSMRRALQSISSRWSARSPATSRIAARTAVSGPSPAGRFRSVTAEQREALGVVGEERVLLRVEVPEERAGRDLRRGGDLLDGHVVEAAFGREPDRRVGDLLSGPELLALAQPSRHGTRRDLGPAAPPPVCHRSQGTGMWHSVPRIAPSM